MNRFNKNMSLCYRWPACAGKVSVVHEWCSRRSAAKGLTDPAGSWHPRHNWHRWPATGASVVVLWEKVEGTTCAPGQAPQDSGMPGVVAPGHMQALACSTYHMSLQTQWPWHPCWAAWCPSSLRTVLGDPLQPGHVSLFSGPLHQRGLGHAFPLHLA